MSEIGTLIRQYRENLKLTQKELADKLQISPSTVGMYEQNRRTPDIATLNKIAQIFSIPVTMLFDSVTESAYEALPKNVYTSKSLQTIFVNRLSNAIGHRQISSAELALNTDIPLDKCQAYIVGDLAPTLEELSALADALNVSTDYLLGKADTKVDGALASFKALDEDNQDIIVGDMKRYLKEQRRAAAVAEEADERKVVGK